MYTFQLIFAISNKSFTNQYLVIVYHCKDLTLAKWYQSKVCYTSQPVPHKFSLKAKFLFNVFVVCIP